MEVLAKSVATTAKQTRILAVDDNEDNLLLLSEVLNVFDCSLLTATSGQIALIIAQIYNPDLILLDVMLPDLNGIEVVFHLKHNPTTENIPVIAVTALARQEDRDRLLAAGCSDYISKPYMIEDLEAIVRRALGQI
ncbi:response regulator [Chlorogloea sp. CCALA 695]|uniref:response regulator n=1 Tax=Chlorogloea sp. CCALA 695 TaxID=2107693 RepID=UPI000D059507|nr:response regulator [Chlorogloea sp. CCALA 695]PSB35448.1 response regulator [Chlorogloea sp. CCALA 695]